MIKNHSGGYNRMGGFTDPSVVVHGGGRNRRV